MLFKGVQEERLGECTGAQSKASEDVAWWRDVVGMNFDRARDESLYRVLEWGGMEVLKA